MLMQIVQQYHEVRRAEFLAVIEGEGTPSGVVYNRKQMNRLYCSEDRRRYEDDVKSSK